MASRGTVTLKTTAEDDGEDAKGASGGILRGAVSNDPGSNAMSAQVRYPGELGGEEIADIRLKAFRLIIGHVADGTKFRTIAETAGRVADWAITGSYPDTENPAGVQTPGTGKS